MVDVAGSAPARRSPDEVTDADVAIVGGGPAGMAAALEVSRRGLGVVLVDEARELGGQYYRPRPPAVVAVAGEFRSNGARLALAVERAGVQVRRGTSIWGVDDDGATLVGVERSSERLVRIRARAVIVATGAHERARAFPGWELPGVTTAGHALHLGACDRVALGRRVAIAGTGPFLLAAAAAVLGAGGGVVAVVEHATPYAPSLAGLRALRTPSRIGELAGYLARLAHHRVRLMQGWSIVRAAGTSTVERVVIVNRHGRQRELEVDALAVGYGFRPSSELIQLLNAQGRVDSLGDFYPEIDLDGRVSRSGQAEPLLYCAGEVAGIAGARAASARGALAGAAVVADLTGRRVGKARRERLRSRLRAELRFAALLARMFPVTAADLAAVDDDALCCRCEGVRVGSVRAAMAHCGADSAAVKGLTRTGMGPCQGRFCASTLNALVTAAGGRAAGPTVRMPLRPVPLASLLDDVPEATA